MAPKINLFGHTETLMKSIGIHPASSRSWIMTIWYYFLLYLGLHVPLTSALKVCFGESVFRSKVEQAIILLAGSGVTIRHYRFQWKKTDFMALINQLKSFSEEIETAYGQETVRSWEKTINAIFYCSVVFGCIITMPVFVLTYYIFYSEGVVALPYELYIPFEKEDHIHLVVLCQFLMMLEVLMVAMLNLTFMGSLVVTMTGFMKKIGEEFEKLSPLSQEETVIRAVRWHSEITMVMRDANALLGVTLLCDYVLAMGYISLGGFLFFKALGTYNSQIYKYAFMYIALLFWPVFPCLCGHLISLASDKLYNTVYRNQWFLLKPEDRKQLLILPGMLACKGVSLNFRKLMDFDMEAYLLIVKQSYSFLTLLKLVDKK